MQKQSLNKKSIFQTQPKLQPPSFQHSLKQLKTYTHNLTHHLNQTLTTQDKAISRRKYQLQKQLSYLRQKHFIQRKLIRQMEQYFYKYCQYPLQTEIDKWNQNQGYFQQMCQQYGNQVEIQGLINEKSRQKITLLRAEVKEKMREELRESVTERLELYHLSRSRKFITKKSSSTISQRKTTKINTQTTQPGDAGDFHFIKRLQRHTEQDEHQIKNPLCQGQQMVRSKTNTTLPVLKRSVFLDPQKIKNDECGFMKPIGTVKRGHEAQSILPQMIRFLHEYKMKQQQSDKQMEWFQKVVFNNRNFQKLITTLKHQYNQLSTAHSSLKSPNKVKQLVAKNLFRLKTQSTVESSQLKQVLNHKIKNKKRILSYVKNASQSERLMKK